MFRNARLAWIGAAALLAVAAGCGDDDDGSPNNPKSDAARMVCELAAGCASESILGERDDGFIDGYVESCLEDYDCLETCESAIGSSCVEEWVIEQGHDDCMAYCGG